MLRVLVPILSVAALLSGCGATSASPAATATGHTATGSAVATTIAQQKTAQQKTAATGATTTATTPKPSRAAQRQAALARHCPSLEIAKLPQTTQLPSATTKAFRCEMAALWAGVQSGKVDPALPAFFPEAAYAQLKGIANPDSDWGNRLVGDYALDIQAAHALLGADAAQAKLVKVVVPSGFAHVVPPGVCYNTASYWETPNSRVVYSEGGTLHSFGIASMISWRGYWYVVHLGAILRSGAGGEVDSPSAGVGVAVPSSTC